MSSPKHATIDDHAAPERLLRLRQIQDRTGFRRTWIYAEILAGRFPRPRKLGRSSVWPESEIDTWIRDRLAETAKP